MSSLWRTVLVLALASLLGGCGSAGESRHAGIDPGDGSGMGGTGMLAEESGLGGTGIVGEITGFGSIFVNGAEVEVTADTVMTVDGEAVARHDFAIGEVVALRTVMADGLRVATEAHLRHEVIGTVSARGGARTIRVLGQTVRVISGPLPAPGERVRVAGFRDALGVVHATRLAPAGDGPDLIVGRLARTADGWRIGDQAIVGIRGVSPNRLVRLRGRLRQDGFRVDRIEVLPPLPFRQPVARLLIQGFLQASDGAWRIGGVPLPSAPATVSVSKRPLRLELLHDEQGWRIRRRLPERGLPRGRAAPLPGPGPVLRPDWPGRAGPMSAPSGVGGFRH